MSKLSHLLEKFFENPAKLRFSKIEKILYLYGCVKIKAKGSHLKFKHHLLSYDLIVPVHNNDCKDFYKHSALDFIKNIKKL